MYFKLALRNVRRSFRDYGVYLLTLTFGVCLFYTFNSLDGQSVMAYLAMTQNGMVAVILSLMDIFSVFVAVVLACLILYADHFLMRRRKRELGTYLLLGLEPRQVSKILFLETGIVGLLALVTGLLLGWAVSQGLSALTVLMFQVDTAPLRLAFSLRAVLKTVLYFTLIFLLVMVLSGLRVARAKLLDLLQSERRNEELPARPLRMSALQFAIGVLLLGAAYAMLLKIGMIIVGIPPLCVPMLIMGTIGTLLVFRSLSGFVLVLAQKHPNFYYRGLNMFTLHQWMSRVHTTYLSMTVICILLLLAMGITACSIGMNSTITNYADESAAFDFSLQNYDERSVADGPSIAQRLAGSGLELNTLSSGFVNYILYYNDPEITGADGEVSAAIRQSDYLALLALLGRREPAELGPLPAIREIPLGNDVYFSSFAVIPDELADSLLPRREIFNLNYSGDKGASEARLLPAVEELIAQDNNGGTYSCSSWLENYTTMLGSKVLVLFLGLYLGFTFLLAAAAVLALQQLSQAADNGKRYRLLRKLGTDEATLSSCATHQVALAFLAPLALALLHTVVGMTAANALIAQMGVPDTVGSSLTTAIALLLVYGGYFLATSLACRRMARSA